MPRWSLPLLAFLFFCSGVCALIYQVMWLRMLALVFGVTVYAASTVLASFMGGLALGSFVAGRLAGRMTSPLRVFGIIEIGVGLSALATPLVMDVIRSAWIALSPSLPSSLLFMTVSRFVAAVAVLIVPTTLMGATLPVVMRSALVSDRSVGARIGLLYAINTAGAIVGALIAGFYLVAEVGLTRSFQLAALLNVSIGVVAILTAGRVRSDQRDAAEMIRTVAMTGDRPTATQGTSLTTAQRYAVLWTFLLSGVMSLALEIVWFRMLVTMLRPTAYAFTIMLAAVLAGIALGSAIAAPLLRRRREWLVILTGVQLMIGLTAVLSLNTLRYIQAASEFAVPTLTRIGLDPYLGPIIVASLLAMLPTTLLLGFAFPVGLSLWVGAAEGSSRRIGSFYSLNVCGAIIGSVLGGFVLLPLLGSRGSLIATAALAALSSILLAIPQWRARPNFSGFMVVVGPIAFAMASLNAVDPYAITRDTAHRNERVVWRQEGVQTTVAIHESGRGPRPSRIMYLDGMHQASDLPPMTFVHHRIGAFPMLLHPNPKAALVVGLGGGATAGAVAQYPGVSVDVVELSSAVVGGASFFGHINFGVLQRPNVQLRVDDGRNYLLTTTRKYDIITADIILPRHAGAGALYSREYFQLVRNALEDDGLALQWNGAEGAAYGLIVRTFLSVFPHATLWADGTLMVGSKKPLEFSRASYEQRRANPEFRKLFDWSFDEIVATYAGGPPELAQWAGDGDILTDDRPVIEYFLSLPDDQPPDLRRLVARPSDIVRP